MFRACTTYGRALDGQEVRARIRHALGGQLDDLRIPQDEAFAAVITAAIDNCPRDEI